MNESGTRLDWRIEFDRLEGAYSAATMRSYRSDIGAFVAWCDRAGLKPFPAEVATVCAFLDDQARSLSVATVQHRLSAIRKIHQLQRLPDPTQDEDVNLAIRRIRRSKFARPKQAKGLTRDYLKAFLEGQPDTPWGLRNRAMMALGYDLLTRRSELVALRTDDLEFRPDGTLRVLIRRSKSDPYGKGRIAFTSRQTATLTGAWLDWRGPRIAYLFCPIYKQKAIDRGLSATTVKRMIKSAAERAGLDPVDVEAFSGHSMRVGAAQDLLSAGHQTAAIMRAGGWKSLHVLAGYLEHAEHNVWREQ